MDEIAEQPFALYLVLALVAAVLPAGRARAIAGIGLALAALGTAAESVGGFSAGSTFATINEILIGLGAIIVATAGVLAWRARRFAGGYAPAGALSGPRTFPDPLLLAGFLLAAAGPHLILLGAGAFLCLLAAARMTLQSRRGAWLVLLVVGVALLGAAFFLLFTILGAAGGRMSELSAGPFSLPAERLIVLLTGCASLVLAGLPPFHRAPWRLLLAPLVAMLLVRVLIPTLPGGLGDWRAPAMLFLVVALAVGAVREAWPQALVAGGLFTLWSGFPGGVFAGCLLVLWGWLLEAGVLSAPGAPLPLRGRWSGLVALLPALAAPFALGATLAVEVVLSVVAVLVLAVGFGIAAMRRPRPA